MHMTLIQMQDVQLQHTKLEEAQQHADEMINDIEDIKNKKLEYDNELLNN